MATTADLRDRPADEVRPSAASAEDAENEPSIMIVDDDPSMQTYLAAFLSERGYASAAFDDAERAVRQFEKERPAAVILDVEMPGAMDGLGALAAFKKIDRDLPIIMLSGQGRTSVVVQAMKLGAADFVTKPFEENDLITRLASALKQHQLKSHRSPTAIAAAAMGAGHYALKAISRTAAREAERALIFTVLQRTHWNRKETAEILGISYKALLYKIKENGLEKAS